MRDVDAWLNQLVSSLNATDRALADELRGMRRSQSRDAHADRTGTRSLDPQQRRETRRQSVRNIVLRVGRPVLQIVGGSPQLEFKDSESGVWRERLQASADGIRRAAAAVGRIEVAGLHGVRYIGTGWIIDQDTIVTNRHVARQIGRTDGAEFGFRKSSGAPAGSIDFLEEFGRVDELACPIDGILYIEDDDGPDLALLRVARTRGQALAAPIPLATKPPASNRQVAVIGYPARDRRVPDADLMQSIFGDVYEKKRLAPGQITDVHDDVLMHDCSTLGGNSGSVVLDLATGEALGLHFAGRFLEANFAVPAAVVRDRLERARRGKPGKPSARPDSHNVRPPAPLPAPTPTTSSADSEPILEGVPEDYIGRAGYDPAFLGADVPLPVVARTRDVLTFTWDGHEESELKYQHFSVVMSRSRRLCFFSAVNIDGSSPRRFKRPAWRLDARIPARQQIKEECYGPEPQFSRGHMTRREDPIWGDPDRAALGNSDSMHVTNTVPQMQPFNAGIWLSLESYALEHAREDDMRIAVITGPFLQMDDPSRDGVAIPRSFWKVIAFIHDETNELTATGYTMSQDAFLRDEEFVFGKHQTAQTRIADIERRAGVSFGPLAALDPFDDPGHNEACAEQPLTDPAQIRFRR